MATFVAIIWEPESSRLSKDNPGFMDYMNGYSEFGEKAGAAVVGGAALDVPSTSTTIHVVGGRDGDVVMQDGPFAEGKEFLSGFYVLEAADLDEAIGIARYIPAAWRDGGRIEVRPHMQF